MGIPAACWNGECKHKRDLNPFYCNEAIGTVTKTTSTRRSTPSRVHHRVETWELGCELRTIDNLPIFVHSAEELDMCVYSWYYDDVGFHIDVGPLGEE